MPSLDLRPRLSHLLVVLFICALIIAGNLLAEHYQPRHSASVRIAEQEFVLEVAATNTQRKNGLMHRRDLAPCGGMVFLFPRPALHAFWMHDTPTPLWMAFVSPQSEIVTLYPRAAAMNDTPLSATQMANSVIEINADCPKLADLRVGDAVSITLPDDVEIR